MTDEPKIKLVPVTRHPTHALYCRSLETGERVIVLTTPVRRMPGEKFARFMLRARTKLRTMIL